MHHLVTGMATTSGGVHPQGGTVVGIETGATVEGMEVVVVATEAEGMEVVMIEDMVVEDTEVEAGMVVEGDTTETEVAGTEGM